MHRPDEQLQGCFVADFEDQHEQFFIQSQELHLEITQPISRHLPANELRTSRRPEQMVPRTFFLQRPPQLLPSCLNLPCPSLPSDPPDSTRVKQRIQNVKNLSLQQYFQQRKFQLIYNKLKYHPNEYQQFVGRLKGVDYLIDYNWKCFTELPKYRSLPLPPQAAPEIDSDFEGGNICKVYQRRDDDEWFYYCLIENDVNTHGYNIWFFFRCRNSRPGLGKFKIANMIKRTTFFAQGMPISVFSMKRWEKEGTGWFLGGRSVGFNRINLGRSRHNDHYYSLYFQYEFEHENDEVYFALGQPYTYSRLVNTISSLRLTHSSTLVEVKTLTYSICNNIIPVVKFSLPNKTYTQSILVLGRQHPCETVGSFIAEAIMQSMTRPQPAIQWLLESFEIIVIPMVNPDGVIHGMSRTNMAGLDLNRHWGDHIIKQLTPQTLKIKNFILNLSKTRKIKYMLDLHGHGKKLNSFFFCSRRGERQRQNYRLLVMAMGKLDQRFSMQSCTFGIDRDKESTVRSMLHSMGIKHSYTLQTSLYGYKNREGTVMPFCENDYRSLGQNLLRSVFIMEAPNSLSQQLLGTTKEAIIAEMTPLIDSFEKDEQVWLDNQQNVSDSDPEGDRLDVKQLLSKCCNKVIKKKIQESLNADPKKHKRMSTLESKRKILSDNPLSQSQVSSKMATSNLNRLLSRHDKSRNKRSEKSTSNNYKTIMGERWKERQKEKKNMNQGTEKKRDLIESLNLTRPKLRQRIKTEPSSQVTRDKLNHAGHKNNMKTFVPVSRMTTEAIDLEAFRQVPKEVKQLQDKVLQRERIVKDVRQGNFNHFLTDTMSIIKITPHQKYPTFSKQISCDPRKEKVLIRQTDRTHPVSPTRKEHHKQQEELKNVSCCQPAARVGHHRSSKSGNSVFYYFPML